MQINITIEKKYAWLLILVIFAVGLVVAFNTNNPPVMGHTFGEIQSADANNNGIVDTAENAQRLEGKTLAEVQMSADFYTVNILENVGINPGGSMSGFAYACGSGEYGCCGLGALNWCNKKYPEKNYKYAIVTGSCGVGWCRTYRNNPCTHTIYCVR